MLKIRSCSIVTVTQHWDSSDADDDVDEAHTGESLASEFSAVRDVMGLGLPRDVDRSSLLDNTSSSSSNRSHDRSGDITRRRRRRRRGDFREDIGDGFGGYNNGYDDFDRFGVGTMSPGGRREGWDEDREEDEAEELFKVPQRPPKTNQDAADAAGAGVVAALMEVGSDKE